MFRLKYKSLHFLHAMRRVSGSGGRYANKTEVDPSKNTTGSGSIMSSSQSVNSTCVHSESGESWKQQGVDW
ncbi:hypothetical protein QVD17_36481 [Tagetes erecta]|uniref:Uncharacterized protein n=1 Tax=Tagetes erecta TaxID=13708 RepID=A0AAD8NBX4_TARER|nr:hypothetical protein QVD17_36481 [Tagetes erecta]